ncbi:FIST N-terminal domain-containing protein [Sedimentitalea todarodis]|uniref:FIST N-terminal domain-containing protein n=1 Tax=Sedimentitalea todarodis TaxID=1631240 RepID=A0ABU3VI05_9RHOB|nr:FIST N-terminal domain-containing protein [Sedimentitalea todarodis]MDU9005780.1 FIST N-terminal domain-containing protein [Sedimentitalea todarodis]
MLQVPVKPAFVDTAVSYEKDATAAVDDIAAQLDSAGACFLLVFVPDGLNLDDLAMALNTQFAGLPMFGCTTAGQITPQGYETEALLVLSFPKAHFRCATHLVTPLKPLSIKQVASDVRKLSAQFQRTAHWSRLALTLSDGLSKQEDMLVAALQSGLEEMPVFGGSAGNGLNFRETSVLHMGQFHSDAALILLLETDLEFAGLGFDHFLPTGEQMVVTEALPEERLALEINGSPAAEEYARLVGVEVDELSPQVFAENPVLVRNHELYHVRAIQGVQDGGALSFLSAIDMGLLLTLGRGQEILRTLNDELDVKSSLGKPPDFILGFDCFLRKLEIDQKDLTGSASEILRGQRVLGFNTYGEQHCGVHVNQTFVGVAFYEPKKRDLH